LVRQRSAFTLIELIFAIVVISITVVSLPVMNRVLTKGMESNLVQEAIFAAATELNQATTAHWDDNSIEAGQPYSLARVIDIDGNCNSDRQMPGHINQPLHRRCLDSSTVGAANANSDANVTSLDDMAGTEPVFISNTADKQSGYKTDYNATVTVTPSPTFDGVARANMKKISVAIKNGTATITTLTTYSANIGEVDYYKKEY